ncbi:fibrillin-1-like [Ptychodera flava]|uniref:fibrillin-1-like n=1 Tax=Ptychodera flava TaxID=63121 RepID=UPI00396A2426
MSVCSPPCRNGGRCVGPQRCSCPLHFFGNTCEIDDRRGPCFTKVENGTCQEPLEGVIIDKIMCCATVGRAWGTPCEVCPPHPYPCYRGFIQNAENTDCIDIDECVKLPDICNGNQCINVLGSYRCKCEDRTRDTGGCAGRNDCTTVPLSSCENGECIVGRDGFTCKCRPMDLLSEDGTKCNDGQDRFCSPPCQNGGLCTGQETCFCQPYFHGRNCEIDDRREPCFTKVENSTCLEPLEGLAIDKKLCCATVGRAWGTRCEVCPPHPDECQRGFMKSAPNTECLDIDECIKLHGICGAGTCINTIGSYTCDCERGRRSFWDSIGCRDINECETIPGICENGVCLNTEQGFVCECPHYGYFLSEDGTKCIEEAVCNPMCKYGGKCIAPQICSCPRGFTGKSCEIPTCTCADKDITYKRHENNIGMNAEIMHSSDA